MAISLRSGKELDEPKVVEKAPMDKGKEVIVEAGIKSKKKDVYEELLSNQNAKSNLIFPLLLFPKG